MDGDVVVFAQEWKKITVNLNDLLKHKNLQNAWYHLQAGYLKKV